MVCIVIGKGKSPREVIKELWLHFFLIFFKRKNLGNAK